MNWRWYIAWPSSPPLNFPTKCPPWAASGEPRGAIGWVLKNQISCQNAVGFGNTLYVGSNKLQRFMSMMIIYQSFPHTCSLYLAFRWCSHESTTPRSCRDRPATNSSLAVSLPPIFAYMMTTQTSIPPEIAESNMRRVSLRNKPLHLKQRNIVTIQRS